MPWKESDLMERRTEFVLRTMRGVEPFGELCAEFGISRKTGYKWKERFLREGLEGLADQSRRPKHSPEKIDETMVCAIVKLRTAHPGWGAAKLRVVLGRSFPAPTLPSESSIKRILDKAGLVERRRRVRTEQTGRLQTPIRGERPNQVWTIDFKGWWYTGNRTRFEPLTIRDDYSRYLLCAQALPDARTETVRKQMTRVFERHGLPEVLRSDNGAPFASKNGPLGLSRLSAWWVTLGISLDRIRPARPAENGGHERMHRDLASEVEARAAFDAATQQAELDVWRKTFNEERPHEALGLRVPHEFYQASSRKFDPASVELVYPAGYLVRKVNGSGSIKLHNSPIFVSEALRHLEVGLEPLDGCRFAVWFCRLCLGQLDLSTQKFQVAAPPEAAPADQE